MSDNSRFFFVLASVGAALGIGSIWAFPYLSFNFGGWFFLAYFIALIVLGIPLLVMEFTGGQYFRKTVVDAFCQRPFFGPLGWLMVFNAFLLMSIYAARLAWNIIYVFVSFGLQWKGRAESYFYDNVLQVSGAADFSSFSLAVFIALVLAWILIYPIIRKGFESLSRSLVIIMPIGALLMVVFLLYSLTLENALAGVYSIFHGSFSALFGAKIWIAAFSYAATSIGVSFGIMHAVSQKAKGFIVRTASITILFEILVGFALSFILFGFLGHLILSRGMDMSSAAFSEYSMTFTRLAEVLPMLYSPTIASILFFSFLGIFFLIGACALAYSIVNVISRKLATKNRNAAIIIAGFGFLLGLGFVVRPGFYVMELISHYFYYNIMLVLLLQCIYFGWAVNSKKLAGYMNETSFFKLGNVIRVFVRYVVPVILIVLISSRIREDWMGFRMYPWWTVWVFGIGTIVVPAVAAFLMPQKILDRK